MAHDHDEENGVIEGLIYRDEKGVWTAYFGDGEFYQGQFLGRVLKVQVDNCPWCGKELK